MGLLMNGQWKDEWYDNDNSKGEFVRGVSTFRHWISTQKSQNIDDSYFPPAKGRYHLFVSYACPWAHRTLILRNLKKLNEVISVSVVQPHMLDKGWVFADNDPSLKKIGLELKYLHQLYTTTVPNFTGRVTVPVLWDKKQNRIVSNESSEIIRMFNSAFHEFSDADFDFYPEPLRESIDSINELVYQNINNGVYKCGFATTQQAYEISFDHLFTALDSIEKRLGQHRYLIGNRITEADWRLFTTLVRFDVVYFGHFKTNRNRIADFPNLSNYLKDLYQVPGVKETVHLEHIKQHYYFSHSTINPTRVVPKGPNTDFASKHDRDRFLAEPQN